MESSRRRSVATPPSPLSLPLPLSIWLSPCLSFLLLELFRQLKPSTISPQAFTALTHIFSTHCSPSPSTTTLVPTALGPLHPAPAPTASLTQGSGGGLEAFARATNGAPFDQASLDEITTFFDVTPEGGLTLKGFLQMYQLQTENDEEETWKSVIFQSDRNTGTEAR